MNKHLRNGLIVLGVLVAVFFLNQYSQKKYATSSQAIFQSDTDDIYKILIQKGEDAIELVREGDTWRISGNDTLVIRQNRLDNLFTKVLAVQRETLISKNPEKWSKFSVDDSSGTHLALIDKDGETLGYFVFGRSKSDWSHNYVRFQEKPEVYLTDTNVMYHLNTRETFWGEVPKPEEPEEPDTVITDSTVTTTDTTQASAAEPASEPDESGKDTSPENNEQ